MKICLHNGLLIAVLTRNEHCPPHVHVGTNKWEARFEFSFWHSGLRLMDVVPTQNQPTYSVLEDLRQVLKLPKHLRRAREIWWLSTQTVCLDNQLWEARVSKVVNVRHQMHDAFVIKSAHFDPQEYKTLLSFLGQTDSVEIKL